MAIDDSIRLIIFKIILLQSSAECIAGRRRFIRHTLERIREGSATGKEVAIIRSALQQVGKLPGTNEDKRRMATLSLYYLLTEPVTARSVAEELNITIRTFHSDINHAIDFLTVAVFGVDGVEFQ
jgi:hypothetical protein